MNYQITATLGPSSSKETIWRDMLAAGVTSFRLNTSHISIQELQSWLERLIPFLSQFEVKPPLVLDLQGSKWRLGEFAPFELVEGESIELTCTTSTNKSQELPIPHPDFFKAAFVSNGEIVLNDAKSKLILESASLNLVKARVTQGGMISPHKGITFTASEYRKENIGEKDKTILNQTKHLDFISYAISYVRDAAEMAFYRSLFDESAYLIAKLERKQALDETFHIAANANELWLCRGDLGAEVGIEAMAETVHRFSDQVSQIPVPCIMAGQVLEHVTQHATPTRSEVCYLYDTLLRGYRGFVLSDEVAIGQYPVESCRIAALFKS